MSLFNVVVGEILSILLSTIIELLAGFGLTIDFWSLLRRRTGDDDEDDEIGILFIGVVIVETFWVLIWLFVVATGCVCNAAGGYSFSSFFFCCIKKKGITK